MRSLLALGMAVGCALSACRPLEKPPTREVVELRGTPYERGLQHGTQLRSKIRSFYTTLLTNSLFPYLSREQPDIASLLPVYGEERFQNGQFAYQLMLDSAKSVERSLGRPMRDELQGIADGSGLTYDQILVLNTFVDTVLAVRGIALAIRLSRAPLVTRVEFLGARSDGVDNDEDGSIDEDGEGVLEPYLPELHGSLVELPTSVGFKLTLTEVDGVDPATVRLFLGDRLYTRDSPEVTMTERTATELDVVLVPSEPLPAGVTSTLVVGAGDRVLITVPPPTRASYMRDEEVAFSTRGAGVHRSSLLRVTLTDGRTKPPPFAVAVRGPMTVDGAPYLAQHFSLLDANSAHKHTVVLRHVTESGQSFVTVGWAGIVYGFSGLSDRGLGYTCNPSDTLDNSVVGSVLAQIDDLTTAKLAAKGLPMGFLGRRILEQTEDATAAQELFAAAERAYGWTCAFADRQGALTAIEGDSDVFADSAHGTYRLSSTETDGFGVRPASTSDDDYVLGSNFVKDYPDVPTLLLAGQRVVPQRQWSGFFYRSRRAVDGVKRELVSRRGRLDPSSLQEILADPRFVDTSDSMNAVVLDPRGLRVWTAMGEVPATDAPFEVVEVRP